MNYTFKKLKLSDAERLWLNEIMKANFSPINAKSMKIRLWDKLPADFNPKEINWRLIHDNRLTLIGMWHVDPSSPIFSHISKTIEVTRDLIMKNPEIKEVTAKEISELVGITEREAEIALILVCDLPGFFGGWSRKDGYGCQQATFSHDDSAYDRFLRFENLEREMEELFAGRNPRRNGRKKALLKGQSMVTSETFWKQPSSKDIWSDIFEDFEVTKHTFGKNINFVTDDYKRKAIFRDIEQAYILAKNGFSKPAVILAGSVIEELLRLYLEAKNVKAPNNTFDEYIKTCEQKGFLKGAISRLSDSVRHFRNLVHLEKETSTRHKISKATAMSAVASIFIISNDFRKN